MANSRAHQILEYCHRISSHCCCKEASNCSEFREQFSSIMALFSSLASSWNMPESCLPLENVVADSYNGLVEKVNLKTVCRECEILSRCFICWLIVFTSRSASVNADIMAQHVEIVLKSVKLTLRQGKNDELLRSFEELLRLYHGYLHPKYSDAFLARYKLKMSLSLALLNANMGCAGDADFFLTEAENQANGFSNNIEDIVNAYCSIVHAMDCKLSLSSDKAAYFAERCLALLENNRVSFPDKKIRILRFLAVVSAKKGEFQRALDYVDSAESIEKSFLLLVTRLRILVLSTAAGKTDVGQLTSSMQDIVCSPDFTIAVGIYIVKRLYADNHAVEADHFLSLMWQSLEKKQNVDTDVFPLFCYRLHQCLQKGDVSETQRMFLFLDKVPSLIAKIHRSTGLKICSMLNWHGVLFVKTRQFNLALTCFELCDHFLCNVLPTLSETGGKRPISTSLANSVPSIAQVKRSLAICQFQVGNLRCEQTLRDASEHEISPWIDFIWYYMAVRSSNDAVALEHLQKIFSSSHSDAEDLLQLSSNVAITQGKRHLAITALRYLVNSYFEHFDSSNPEIEKLAGKILSAVKTLISLNLESSKKHEELHGRSSKQLCEETTALVDYLGKGINILTTMVELVGGNNSRLIENIKWFSENCWHISNNTNGLMMKKMDEATDWSKIEDDFANDLRLALFTLYRQNADLLSLLLSVIKPTSDSGWTKVVLHKYCLCLSLCLASGIQYLRLLQESGESRMRFALSLLDSLKECYKVVNMIVMDKDAPKDVVIISCGGLSMIHTLPLFEFEILMILEKFDDAQSTIVKFAEESKISRNSNMSMFNATSADQLLKSCSIFERFAKVAEECSVRYGTLGLDCYRSLELCLRSLCFALTSYSEAEAMTTSVDDSDEFSNRTKELAVRIRSAYESCRKYARDRFFSKGSNLFGLINQLTTMATSFWKRISLPEAYWIISCCWNANLDRLVQNLNEDAKAWFTLAENLAKVRGEDKMLSDLRDRLQSLKKWQALDLGDCCD